jgi:hypothetical protein
VWSRPQSSWDLIRPEWLAADGAKVRINGSTTQPSLQLPDPWDAVL